MCTRTVLLFDEPSTEDAFTATLLLSMNSYTPQSARRFFDCGTGIILLTRDCMESNHFSKTRWKRIYNRRDDILPNSFFRVSTAPAISR